MGSGRPGQGVSSEGQLLPLKFWSEVRNCIWCWTISMISRGGVKINVSRYVIKLDFWPWPRLLKNSSPPRAWFCVILLANNNSNRQCVDPVISSFDGCTLFLFCCHIATVSEWVTRPFMFTISCELFGFLQFNVRLSFFGGNGLLSQSCTR